MIIHCPRKSCKHEFEVREEEYTPGATIEVECPSCWKIIEVTIPGTPKAPKATKKSNPKSKTIQEVPPTLNNITAETSTIDNNEAASDIPQDAEPPKSEISKEVNSKPEASSSTKSPKQLKSKPQSAINKRPTPKVNQAPNPPVPTSSSTETVLGCGCMLLILLLISGVVWWFFFRGENEDLTTEEVPIESVEEAPVEEYVDYNRDQYYQDLIDNAEASSMMEDEVEEETPESEDETTPQLSPMGFSVGLNRLQGDMIDSDGNRYPFKIHFTYDPQGETPYKDAIYTNIRVGTTIKMKVDDYNDSYISFLGYDNGKTFRLNINGSNPYQGDSFWGDSHHDVELQLVNK